MVLSKPELEAKLKDENSLIRSGVLRDENPLDLSDEFKELIEACRRGDLKRSQELISAGVNINGKDAFDYTPLIVASLCGHFDLVRFLLEAGALAERNTFQGERCIYNALNDKIRKLLLQYDYSKSTDPLQPWSSHISSLLSLSSPSTADISLVGEAGSSFDLHKFLLVARTPYFRKRLADAPGTKTWKLTSSVPVESFRVVVRYLYLGELPRDFTVPGSATSEEDIFKGIDKISKSLEVEQLWDAVLAANDRRLARQRYQDEVQRAQAQVEDFFRESVLGRKMVVETDRAQDIKWPLENSLFADCLLQADEAEDDEEEPNGRDVPQAGTEATIPIGLGMGGGGDRRQSNGTELRKRRSTIYPAHKAMLIRSPFFSTMFSGPFMEAQPSEHLRIIKVDCSPEVLEVVLAFLYTEKADCPLELALELLYTADMLLLDKLKTKAAGIISALGSGGSAHKSNHQNKNKNGSAPRSNGNGATPHAPGAVAATNDEEEYDAAEAEPVDVYDVIHAAWDLRVQRLEEFAARYIADRLEAYIDEPEFAELIRESAGRLRNREETDTIELLDDIRYYLSERFRLRFEDAGWEDMMDDEQKTAAATETASPTAASGDEDAAVVSENYTTDAIVGASNDGSGTRNTAPSASADGVPRSNQAGPTHWISTLDGRLVEDEFEADAANYQVLLGKIDDMLERLKLDA